MIAMRVTFSRACARARKKKVILYARANARKMRARESEEEILKKKCVFRYRYKSFLFLSSLSLVQSFFSQRGEEFFFLPNIFSFSPEVGIVYV